MLKFISFGSGSSGNSYYLYTETDSLLIDVGVGIRTLKKHFHNYGLRFEDVHHILITHDHADHAHKSTAGTWAVLTGDSVHCFGDGVLIASAFLADWHLGLAAAVAVLAHEVPHHMGDLAVLRQGADSRRAALVKVSLAGAVTAIGGLVGYFLVSHLEAWLPLFLVVASSSFIYVALADLIPQLQKRLSAAQSLVQIGWLLLGVTPDEQALFPGYAVEGVPQPDKLSAELASQCATCWALR